MIFAKFRDIISALGYREYTYFISPLIWNDELIFYLITRSLTAILGALTVIPVFLTAEKMFGRKAGWLAGLAFAITPFHVWHSHYSMPDVPMVFFLAWALYFIVKILFKNASANYLLAGLFIGLAASTKYNGLLIAGGLVLAHFMRVFSEKNEKLIDLDSWGKLLIAGLASIVSFIAGTPYAVLDFETFIRTDGPKGALWQFTNVGSVSFTERIEQFAQVMVFKLPENVGYTFMALFVTAFIYVLFNLIRKRNLWEHKDLMFFTLLGLGLIFFIAGSEKTRAQYFFVAYPAVVICGMGFFKQQLDRLRNRYKDILWVLVFTAPLYFSLIASYAFYLPDSRVQFYKWMQNKKIQEQIVYILDEDLSVVFQKLDVNTQYGEVDNNLVDKNSIIVDTKETENMSLEIVNKFGCCGAGRGPKIFVYKP
jgi:4-amino-4-deoxy-L-arabinose transferase-like glycosyltransferase